MLRPDASAPAAAFPRLVASEPVVLAEFRAQEEAFLTSYGWVEKDKGLARMPIDEAMKIVAERGPADVPGARSPSPAPAGGAR